MIVAALFVASAARGAPDPCAAGEAPAHEPTAYACEALALVDRFGVAADAERWPAIRARVLDEARRAASAADVHAIVEDALREVDRHSRVTSARWTARLADPQSRRDRVLTNPSTRIAYVDVRGFSGTNPRSVEAYVAGLREGLADAEREGACGYVVDLRRNPGGNMWPALLGLQPLLGEGVVGAFRTRDGTLSRWRLDAARAMIDDNVIASAGAAPAAASASTKPVAILLGTDTASAGEAIAIAFRERPSTRSFGWHTAGLTTANAGFHLRDDATLFLAVAQMTDRDGRAYVPYVVPDEETVAALRIHKTGRYEDVTRKAAMEWLAQPGRCGPQGDAP